jgi:signal transduction histidine kinase
VSLINGYAEGLKDGIVSGQKRDDFIDIIIDEARKMGLLVSNMLDYSQLDSGHLNLQEDKFCIVELLKHNIKQFANPLQEKMIRVCFNSSKDRLLVWADPYRIDLVIANILNNALRYTPLEGEITIHVREDNMKAMVEIENQGEPIPEDSLERIWDPFYRVEQSRNSKYGGTGLGLSIVSTILQLHNSDFGVNNTPYGVKFHFTLPTAQGN